GARLPRAVPGLLRDGQRLGRPRDDRDCSRTRSRSARMAARHGRTATDGLFALAGLNLVRACAGGVASPQNLPLMPSLIAVVNWALEEVREVTYLYRFCVSTSKTLMISMKTLNRGSNV